MSVRKEYYELAKKLGYSGDEPRTIAGAIDALADTLAGEDVDSGRTTAEAVRALAPYVGAGGGDELAALESVYATPPTSIVVSLSEDGDAVANIIASNSVVHGVTVSGGPFTNTEIYRIARHAWFELTYPTSTYTSVSVKTYYGDEYPHTTNIESGILYVRFMVPKLGKDSNSPVVVVAS